MTEVPFSAAVLAEGLITGFLVNMVVQLFVPIDLKERFPMFYFVNCLFY